MKDWGAVHRKLVLKYAGREADPGDGVEEADLRTAEKRLGVKLPKSLREYYKVAGNLDLNTSHNQLFTPGELRVENGYLLFMDENQSVVSWGLSLSDLSKEDPVVWQRNNKTEAWYSEEKCFSEFMTSYFGWLTGQQP